MKAIILARVSDKKQDSNEAQVIRISDYVRYKDLTIFKTYEIEESSTHGEREKFQEVVKEIQNFKEPIALVVDTVDRLQRSFRESVLLDDLRKSGKLVIHFYRENLVLHQNSNSADLLRWDIAVMFARSYVLQLSDNVKRKQEQMRRNGEWAGRPPIGYKSIYDANGNRIDIIADPEKGPFIEKLFELYATGNYSIATLRNELTRQGLTNNVGKPLATSMVDHIINNPFYYGEMCSKGKLYPHKYKPLIEPALFNLCQAVQRSWGKKPFQYAAKPYIFRGLLRCGLCGCSMSPETAKDKYVYYSCTNARKELCNKKVYIPEKTLLKPVYKVLRAFGSIPQETIDEVVNEIRHSAELKTLYHKTAINSLQSQYKAAQGKIDRLIDLLLDGTLNQDIYEQKLKDLKSKQKDLNLQLKDHTNADESYYITVSNVLHLAKNALELFESSEVEEKRTLLNFLLQNSVVKDKKLLFDLRNPFDIILNLSKEKSWLPELDTFRATNWKAVSHELRLFAGAFAVKWKESDGSSPLQKQLQQLLEAA